MSQSTVAAAPEAGSSPPRSMRSILLSMEIDTRMLGLIGATILIWIGVQHPVRRLVPHDPQPVESVGPVRGRRGHGDRHGPDHRVAEHRPVDRVDPRVHRDGHGACSRPSGCPTARSRLQSAAHLDHRPRRRHHRRRADRRPAGLRSIAYVGIPSFIVTLGGLLIWRGVAFQLARAGRSPPSTPPSSSSAAGRRGRSARPLSWVVGGLAIVGIVFGLVASRRRRRRYGFPVRPMWAEVTIGVVGSLARRWAPSGSPTPTPGPTASRGTTPTSQRHPDPGGRADHPDRHRDPGPHRDRRRRSS